MGLFSFLKKKPRQNGGSPNNDLSASENALLSQISSIDARGGYVTPELHQQLRDFQMQWLERHYDFSTLDGINSIPVIDNLPGAPTPSSNSPVKSPTGEVYYYLHFKARQYLEAGEFDLAIACQRKSNALIKLHSRHAYWGRDESLFLVKILARAGFVEEAKREKDAIDSYYRAAAKRTDLEITKRTQIAAADFATDLIIMDAHGSVCSECAKYQGRVYSISGNNRLFPKAPGFFFTLGCVHEGCGHTFWPYIHGVNDPDLKYTLSVHPLQNMAYGKDIVTFSNRPFVDDRTEECKRAAAEVAEKQAAEAATKKRYEDNMIEIEAARGRDQRNYIWLQTNLPEKCPKSLSGFRRMKNANTKNYQLLKQAAAELGREI